jgi:hypothetical protein
MTPRERPNIEEGEGLVGLEDLHRRDLAWGVWLASIGCMETNWARYVPLMILQKIQAAEDILVLGERLLWLA